MPGELISRRKNTHYLSFSYNCCLFIYLRTTIQTLELEVHKEESAPISNNLKRKYTCICSCILNQDCKTHSSGDTCSRQHVNLQPADSHGGTAPCNAPAVYPCWGLPLPPPGFLFLPLPAPGGRPVLPAGTWGTYASCMK